MLKRSPFKGSSRSLRDFQKHHRTAKTNRKSVFENRNPKIVERSSRTTPSKTWGYFQRGLVWGASIGLVVGILTIALYARAFRIDHIIISSETLTDTAHIEETIRNVTQGTSFAIIPNDHLLFLRKKAIIEAIEENDPIIRTASVSVRWPSTVHIDIEEKERVLWWKIGTTFYDVDDQGIAFRRTPAQTTQELIENNESVARIIIDQREEFFPEIPSHLATENFIAFAAALPKTLATHTRLTMERMTTPNPTTRELHVETSNGFTILFDTSRNPEHEIKTLNKIVEEKLTHEQLEKLEYIDLRIREKTFYKLKP